MDLKSRWANYHCLPPGEVKPQFGIPSCFHGPTLSNATLVRWLEAFTDVQRSAFILGANDNMVWTKGHTYRVIAAARTESSNQLEYRVVGGKGAGEGGRELGRGKGRKGAGEGGRGEEGW